MGDHNDEPVFRHLFEQFHDLHAGFAVQRARGFVGKNDVGIVDESTGNRHPLHLSAGHLVGLFLRLFFEPDFAERFQRSFAALFFGYASERETELHVFEHGHMRNEIVRLEDEAYAPVAVGVPVHVVELFRGDAVHLYIAACIAVQPADDVEHCGFSAAGRSEDGHEFVLAEFERHVVESEHALFFGLVLFRDFYQFQHCITFVFPCLFGYALRKRA